MKRESARDAVRRAAQQAVEAGETLRGAGRERRAQWLATAFAQLADPGREEHQALLTAASESSGLSLEMTRWALRTTLTSLGSDALLRLAGHAQPPSRRALMAPPGRLCGVVLSSNVCTAAARALGVPLLLGWPVLGKASTRDDVLAWHLAQQLSRVDPELGQALQVVTFPADDEAARTALLEQVDALSAYGSDGTLHELRSALSATATFIGHGHGLGLGLVTREALGSREQALETARACALDVAAYDQRGCLSPHAIVVEEGAEHTPGQFAELLFHEGLAPLAKELPRGSLPMALSSAQLTWRGLSAARSGLREGDGFAVSYEGHAPLRLSPGYRNVQVLAVRDRRHFARIAAPLGVHLKCVGVAGKGELRRVAELLPARLAPRLCAAGTMQTPPGDMLADGVASTEGLVRWVDVD